MFFALVPDGDNPVSEEDMAKLIDLYGNEVLRIAYIYLRDRQLAEDAFQEVFLRVYRKIGSFRGRSSEKTWLIRITVNVCKDMLRKWWWKRIIPGLPEAAEASGEPGPELLLADRDENRRLWQAVLRLPPVLKDVVILYYYKSFDTREISNVLGIPEGTVRNRLHRARQSLRAGLEKEDEIEWIR